MVAGLFIPVLHHSAIRQVCKLIVGSHDFGVFTSGWGLVTEFTYTTGGGPGPDPIPEPSTAALLAGGLLFLAARVRRR